MSLAALRQGIKVRNLALKNAQRLGGEALTHLRDGAAPSTVAHYATLAIHYARYADWAAQKVNAKKLRLGIAA